MEPSLNVLFYQGIPVLKTLPARHYRCPTKE